MANWYTQRATAIVAILLWLIGGIKVLLIGLHSWQEDPTGWGRYLWLAGSMVFFSYFIFPRVVRRNLSYVSQIEPDRLRPYHCFTPGSWGVMLFMMTLGIVVRKVLGSGNEFISGFYVGLGLSLLLSIRFYLPYLRR